MVPRHFLCRSPSIEFPLCGIIAHLRDHNFVNWLRLVGRSSSRMYDTPANKEPQGDGEDDPDYDAGDGSGGEG